MLDRAVTLYRHPQVLASEFPGRRISVAAGKVAVSNMIRIFTYLFNLVPPDVKMALLDKDCSIVKDANTCVQVYFKSGAGEPILARGKAHIAPGLSLHGFCIEVDSICPQ